MAATTVAAVSAAYGISESEKGKKKAKKTMKEAEKKEKQEKSLASMQDAARRGKLRQEQEKLAEGGSGIRSTMLTGGRNTLG